MKDLYGRMFAETVKHYVDTYKIDSTIISEALIKWGDTEISRMFFDFVKENSEYLKDKSFDEIYTEFNNLNKD